MLAWGQRMSALDPKRHQGKHKVGSKLKPRLLLTNRTEERRAPALHDALDGAFAAGRDAALALAVVDPEVVLEHAKRAVGQAVVAQRRAAGLDRIVEHD